MSPKSCLAIFLCLIAVSGASFAADCRFQNQKQKSLKQEQARQQAEAQRQQQLSDIEGLI